jgi:hypothetical protein
VPVIGLVQIGTHAYADRYTYIPLHRPADCRCLARDIPRHACWPQPHGAWRDRTGGGGGSRVRCACASRDVAECGDDVGAGGRGHEEQRARATTCSG